MKAFIRWVVVTIVKDVFSYFITIISVFGLLALAVEFCPDYFDGLFIPIMLGAPLIIAIVETWIHKKRKKR